MSAHPKSHSHSLSPNMTAGRFVSLPDHYFAQSKNVNKSVQPFTLVLRI